MESRAESNSAGLGAPQHGRSGVRRGRSTRESLADVLRAGKETRRVPTLSSTPLRSAHLAANALAPAGSLGNVPEGCRPPRSGGEFPACIGKRAAGLPGGSQSWQSVPSSCRGRCRARICVRPDRRSRATAAESPARSRSASCHSCAAGPSGRGGLCLRFPLILAGALRADVWPTPRNRRGPWSRSLRR